MVRLVGQWRVAVPPAAGPDDDPHDEAARAVAHALPDDEVDRVASLTFDGDGQVYGTGGVNRLRGTWSVTGDTLTFGPMVSTLMAGPPRAMRREQELLRLIAGPLELTTGGVAESASDPALTPDAGTRTARVDLVAPGGERLVLTREPVDRPA